MSVSVDSKPLTETLSLLDATLTKNQGWGDTWVGGTDRANPLTLWTGSIPHTVLPSQEQLQPNKALPLLTETKH
jgi:hypothetical protein